MRRQVIRGDCIETEECSSCETHSDLSCGIRTTLLDPLADAAQVTSITSFNVQPFPFYSRLYLVIAVYLPPRDHKSQH